MTITASRKATSKPKVHSHMKIQFSVQQTNWFPFTISTTNNKLHSSMSILIKIKSLYSSYFQASKVLSTNTFFTLWTNVWSRRPNLMKKMKKMNSFKKFCLKIIKNNIRFRTCSANQRLKAPHMKFMLKEKIKITAAILTKAAKH
jgi:hypothetical protein